MDGLYEKYNFGGNLHKILKRRKIKQKQLSQLSGISESYISQILSGKRQPDFTTLEILCTALQIDVGLFLLKCIMETKLTDAQHREYVVNHILPALEDLEKIIFPEDVLTV